MKSKFQKGGYGRCGAENKFRSRTGRIDCKYRNIRKR